MKKFIEKHLILFFVIASAVYAFIIHCLFSETPENTWFIAEWEAGDILTYVSTVSLGLLAVWQNQKFQKENEKTQQQLEDIIKDSNTISIINKIVEYESDNLKRLQNAFHEFSTSADPQLICSMYGKNISDSLAVSTAMADAENNLDNSFFMIARELRIDLSIKGHDENPLSKAVATYYSSSKDIIKRIKEEPLTSVEKEMVACVKCRDTFLKEREKYLVEQEKKMNKLLYGNISLDEIKKMYNRINE